MLFTFFSPAIRYGQMIQVTNTIVLAFATIGFGFAGPMLLTTATTVFTFRLNRSQS